MSTYEINDPVKNKLSLEQWLDERLAAYAALDRTRCYTHDPYVSFHTTGYESVKTVDGKLVRKVKLHLTDVRPIAKTLNLDIDVEIKDYETIYPYELTVNYKNAELFSIHTKKEYEQEL